MSDELDNLFLQLHWIYIETGLQCDEPHWHLSLQVVMNSNNDGLCNLRILHDYLLHFASGESMTCSVDDVVHPGHNVEVSFLIEEP